MLTSSYVASRFLPHRLRSPPTSPSTSSTHSSHIVSHVAQFSQPQSFHSGPMALQFFSCSECGKVCKSNRGLSQHFSVHRQPARPENPIQGIRREYHPQLNGNVCFLLHLMSHYSQDHQGVPCDRHGNFLSEGTPPVPQQTKSNDDWTPFASREGFELSEILYLKAHLSQCIINQLLDVWSETLIPHDDTPPLTDHRDLHLQIDAVKLGNIPWRSYTAQYQWLYPENGPIPEWMATKYQLWYRDPRQVIHHILINPEFASGIDYAPYHDFHEGKRRYQDFMSGNWAWEQSVRMQHNTLLYANNRFTGYHRGRPHNTWIYVRTYHPWL